ncbi:MAG: formylmethanofuran dehydrogenase [Deltaproteobacteria bacterium]|nr:formylmethanofuran dehydrogenase [Deltaproteobacteria bacterium]MBW1817032.1 formylmethanofuran dehydrogenase [Deltaproteobacteria bacterium]
MTKENVTSEDFNRCADFHGHVCPGLAIGFRAAGAGLEWLRENRSVDEELVAIVENNACGVDAVQVLTGCTFGKGNLIHKDHGKQVFTFIGRDSGAGVRVAMKPGVIELSERHRELVKKIREESATEDERKEFWDIHRQKSQEILGKPVEDLFAIRSTNATLPGKAMIEPSIACDQCGEPTMVSKLIDLDGRNVCKECLDKP